MRFDLIEKLLWEKWDWEISMRRTRVAYHVTNVPRIDDNPPTWLELKCHMLYDPKWDGKLLRLFCVAFSTTLSHSQLPSFSPFPINGQRGAQHWRANLPLERFTEFSMWYCKNSNGFTKIREMYQVRMILTDDPRIERRLRNDDDFQWIDINKPNPFLYREEDGSWYTNDFAIRDTFDRNGINYWVNFVVLNNVSLSGCEWDSVMRDERMKGGEPLSENEMGFLNFEQWSAKRQMERED